MVLEEMAGTVRSLHRYPVKSLVGESLPRLRFNARGAAGDRLWAVRDPDGKLGSGKSTRRFRAMQGLLALSASYDGEVPVVCFPDGRTVRGDDEAVHAALSAHVGRPVALSRESDVSHFDDGPVHLLTTSSLHAAAHAAGAIELEVERFRPNVVLDTGRAGGFLEEGWVGRRLALGEVELMVRAPMPRCVMVNMAQRSVAAAPGLLAAVTESSGGSLGVLADVVRPGVVGVGDGARLLG